jgi:hypothetical protein
MIVCAGFNNNKTSSTPHHLMGPHLPWWVGEPTLRIKEGLVNMAAPGLKYSKAVRAQQVAATPLSL